MHTQLKDKSALGCKWSADELWIEIVDFQFRTFRSSPFNIFQSAVIVFNFTCIKIHQRFIISQVGASTSLGKPVIANCDFSITIAAVYSLRGDRCNCGAIVAFLSHCCGYFIHVYADTYAAIITSECVLLYSGPLEESIFIGEQF